MAGGPQVILIEIGAMIAQIVDLRLRRVPCPHRLRAPGAADVQMIVFRKTAVCRLADDCEEEARLRLIDIIRSVVLEPTASPVGTHLLNLILESVLEKDFVVSIFDDLF